MILIDSSAWVEFLQGTDSTVCEAVSILVVGDEPIATTDVVVLELMAGCRTSVERRRLWSLLNRCRALPVRPLFDYEAAALLYSACRAAGVTPRTMTDCLIAVVAMHHETPLLHADATSARSPRLRRWRSPRRAAPCPEISRASRPKLARRASRSPCRVCRLPGRKD